MSDERSVANLISNRHVLHRPGHKHQFTVSRHNEHVRRKIAPMIQSGEIEHVLWRTQQNQIEAAGRHLLAGGCQTTTQFFIRKRVRMHSYVL